jgi:hypothetical protein
MQKKDLFQNKEHRDKVQDLTSTTENSTHINDTTLYPRKS